MHTVICLCSRPPYNIPSFSPLCLSFHLFLCMWLCITETTSPSTLTKPPPSNLSISLSCMCFFSLHTLLHSFFCFPPSCRHILPSGDPSLPPPTPLSAVPVGLWAGRVWAPAAFSKASAAAPATDPSNTATLTSIYTYIHVCRTLRLVSSANSPCLYLAGRCVLCSTINCQGIWSIKTRIS